ncbi:MAG TPA: acetyl-CoA C-acyltransferase [Anaerolineaceae bacterium]|nr:acetyl-CoA C-acyltransferase [Anaerolineaceae bacterium]
MHEVVIIDTVRTPIGALGGVLSKVRPDDLAAHILKSIVERTQIDPAIVEEVYLGCANQAGEDNRNIARMATLLAGFPVEVTAVTINRLCASGLTSINMAARAIRYGEGDVFIAGGVESMSRAPYSLPKAENSFPYGNLTAYDTAIGWRYPNPKFESLYGIDPMGITAENLAEQYQISREEQDIFALRSNQLAIAAMDNGVFAEEIAPVSIPQRKGDPVIISQDERPRRDTTLEKLSTLKPAFKKDGSVTAGNSSGINDGAAVVLLMSEKRAKELGLKPIARWVGSAAAGVDPRIMGIGPAPATRKLLYRIGMKLEDVDLIEINEAFAAQTLAVIRELDLSAEMVNVNGGAIALGHPLGCSGARIFTTLIHEISRRSKTNKKSMVGLATLCVGVGQGEASIIESLL